jgi:hypothetical protein
MTTQDMTIVQEAAMMMIGDAGVMRKGELIANLEAHMTTAERGKQFFTVREAVKALIDSGKLVCIEYTLAAGAAPRHLILMPGVKLRVPLLADAVA